VFFHGEFRPPTPLVLSGDLGFFFWNLKSPLIAFFVKNFATRFFGHLLEGVFLVSPVF